LRQGKHDEKRGQNEFHDGFPPLALKRVAFGRPHATRFWFLFSCMSLSQDRCALLGDMHGGLTP
jgi:hypothetical protein